MLERNKNIPLAAHPVDADLSSVIFHACIALYAVKRAQHGLRGIHV